METVTASGLHKKYGDLVALDDVSYDCAGIDAPALSHEG
jgi:hypothetical protein